jgi:hypothetical protein
MRNISILAIIFAFLLSGCGGSAPITNKPVSATPAAPSAASGEVLADSAEDASGRIKIDPLGTAAARKLCYETDTGDTDVLESQTFAINFAPFENSCFVTAHNPEYEDPPMDSEIAIYQNDKKIFDFPGQFNGVTTGCWVEAVAFQDLNGDGMFDIIVIGKCSAKSAPYNENMVYINTGKAFTTNEDANTKASESTTIKAVAEYVRDNREMYFK